MTELERDRLMGLKATHAAAGALEARVSHYPEILNSLLELVKIRITFFVGMSAAFGYIIGAGGITAGMFLPVVGIFMISCASAALNHYQEVKTDSLMHRTRKRPLPTGAVTTTGALALVVGLALAGSLVLYLTGGSLALVLALMAFLWYNGIYTPLKKVSAHAVIPGSFVGSLPVMAGWAAAGGSLLDPRLAAISLFFFVWQIPHFWLLMEIYSADYERAGFPTLRLMYSKRFLAIATFGWMLLLVFLSGSFIVTGVLKNLVAELSLVGLGVWLIGGSYQIISGWGDKLVIKSAFLKINVYVLAVTLLVMIDKVLNII